MSDLVKRLRGLADNNGGPDWPNLALREAVALIEAQQERIKALEAGLDPFAFAAKFTGNDYDSRHIGYSITSGDLRHAASLLEPSHDTETK